MIDPIDPIDPIIDLMIDPMINLMKGSTSHVYIGS